MTGQITYRTAAMQSLVIFAPYPPAKSGIADYVAELVPYHTEEFDVTLVVADDAPIPADTGPRILLASEFRRHRAYFESATKLYHFGNNPQHSYMLDFVVRDPGIVVLHDFNLGYLHEMATLRWDKRQSYVRAMEREYGLPGRAIAEWHLEHDFREMFTGYELPLNGHVLENATAVVTHSRQTQYKVAARVCHAPVWYVPHHLSPAVAAYRRLDKATTRRRTGLPLDARVVTSLGFVTRAKQIPLILNALSTLRGHVPPFRFVLAGERRPEEYDVDADIARSGVKNITRCTDYLDEHRFFELLAASDIVVNLRYPSAGEMSGTLMRALGMGAATIVLDYGPMGELPSSVVRKIAWDNTVQDSLTEVVRELLTQAPLREALGKSAAAYAANIHSIEKVARRYSRIIRESDRASVAPPRLQHFGGPIFVTQRFRELGRSAIEAASASDGSLWWQVAAAPLADDTQRALVLAARPRETADFLTLLYGWNPSRVAAMSVEQFLAPSLRDAEGMPIPAGYFDFALIMVSSDLREFETALLLRRLNAALGGGAAVVLEIQSPADAARESIVLAGGNIRERLGDAGFGDVRTVSPREGLLGELLVPIGGSNSERRSVCVTARKRSDYVVWRYVTQHDGLPMRWGGRSGFRHTAEGN
ncbi:MAG TPA: glycosyltransferase [Candidatus Acidoferrum sp.]|nr:glycosyltransferase [Candidatus Acidoferrum sp.]